MYYSLSKYVYMVKKNDIIFYCILFFNILFLLTFIHTPAIDTETSYIYSAQEISNSGFNFFTPTHEEKPPLLFIFPSILLRFFPSIVWGRIQSVLFATITLYFIYKTGRAMRSDGMGLFAVFLCVFFPMFMAQSVFFTDSMAETAVFSAIVYYFIQKDKKAYLIAASIGMLTKESLALTPILLYIWTCMLDVFTKRKAFYPILKSNLYILYPISILLTWMLCNKIFFGYFVYPGNAINLRKGILLLFDNRQIVILFIIKLLQQGYIWIMVLFFITTTFAALYCRFHESMNLTFRGSKFMFRSSQIMLILSIAGKLMKDYTFHSLFLIILVTYILFYGQFFSWSLRYTLFLFPMLFLLVSDSVYAHIKEKYRSLMLIFFCGLFILYQWNALHARYKKYDGEALNLSFIQQQEYLKDSIRMLLEFRKESTLYTDPQLAHYLWAPIFGYVSVKSKSVFQISENHTRFDCPSCICSTCILANNMPRGKKILIVIRNNVPYLWSNEILRYSTLLKTFSDESNSNATGILSVYEYFRPSER